MDCRMILTLALAMVLVGIIEEGLCGPATKRDKRPVNGVTSKPKGWVNKLRCVVSSVGFD